MTTEPSRQRIVDALTRAGIRLGDLDVDKAAAILKAVEDDVRSFEQLADDRPLP